MRNSTTAMIFLGGAGIDLAVKAWARATLEPYGPAIDFLPFISLRLTFNEGISFSLLAMEEPAGKFVLVAVAAAITAALTLWAFRSKDKYERGALSLIIAGALANLIDRASRGNVTDYLDLHFGGWNPFVFNLADVWISVGAVLLLVTSWRPSREVQVPRT